MDGRLRCPMTYLQINKQPHQHRYFKDYETQDDVCMCGKPKGEGREKISKYHNARTEYNGFYYDSKFEADEAMALDWRIKADEITRWERQIRLDLRINNIHIADYNIDFIAHCCDGSREFIEVKGLELPLWRIKWRILEATFDDFKQHPDDRLILIKQSSFKSNFMKQIKNK